MSKIDRRRDDEQRRRFQELLETMARLAGEDFSQAFAPRLRRILFGDER